jgi:hypothetical protein
MGRDRMTQERFRTIMAVIINMTIVLLIAEYTSWAFVIFVILALSAMFVWAV